jgi:hypothetical protein
MNSDAALQRLAASRASINAELLKLQGFGNDDDAAPPPAGDPASPEAPSAPWFDTTRRALHLWWRRHPARPVLDMASDAGALALKPLVRTHPVASVSLAMAVGAAMVVWRPWRSRVTAVVWAGLGAQLTAGLVKSLLNPGTLMALLGSLPRSPDAPPRPNTESESRP